MIFNMVGGGAGSGATLVVSSPANVSVTVSKDDKSYTKNSGSLGSTTFKGLATGTWTIVIAGNGQTATRTIKITADYAITIAFFSASINITYPATSTCVVTNASGQTVASDSNITSSTKTWTATVNATGTYTVTATDSVDPTNTKSQSVSITTEGQWESVTLSYELVLFDGSDNSEITGGWTAVLGTSGVSYNSIVKNGQMVFVAGVGGLTGLRTVNKIDCSGYTRYCAMITKIGVDVDGRSQAVGWTTSTPGSVNEVDFYVGFTGTGVFSCDISTIDNAYFGLSTKNNGTFTASKIWLE